MTTKLFYSITSLHLLVLKKNKCVLSFYSNFPHWNATTSYTLFVQVVPQELLEEIMYRMFPHSHSCVSVQRALSLTPLGPHKQYTYIPHTRYIYLPWKVVATRATRTSALWGYPPLPHDYPYYWSFHIGSQAHTTDVVDIRSQVKTRQRQS